MILKMLYTGVLSLSVLLLMASLKVGRDWSTSSRGMLGLLTLLSLFDIIACSFVLIWI